MRCARAGSRDQFARRGNRAIRIGNPQCGAGVDGKLRRLGEV